MFHPSILQLYWKLNQSSYIRQRLPTFQNHIFQEQLWVAFSDLYEELLSKEQVSLSYKLASQLCVSLIVTWANVHSIKLLFSWLWEVVQVIK